MGRDGVGEFEHLVLLAILRLGRESYSVPIVLELEERTGREISQAAVFIVLRRLADKGLLDSRVPAAGESSRPRRYFRLTPLGLERLQSARRVLLRLWEGQDSVLDGAP